MMSSRFPFLKERIPHCKSTPLKLNWCGKYFICIPEDEDYAALLTELNHNGYKMKPNNPFSAVSIKAIINNPVYIGKIRYNVRENWSEQRRKGINYDPIIVDGEHERIISQDMWETVQSSTLKKSITSPRVFNGTYLLTGMMRCPDCGATLVAHRFHDTLKDGTKVVQRYYICSNFRAKGSYFCTSNSVKADIAEQYVTDRIAAVVRKPNILEEIVARINNNRTVNVVPLQKELASVDKELGTLDAQKKKYFKLYKVDVVDNEFLLQRMNELKQQHEALTRRRQEALRQLE
ncbi:DNA integration/recombination/inversion protein [Paenibacillus sp. FSL H7-689]|nr:DNA integration/recombination/inversion protein [Paenibacillus sp. FSL H7-689]